MILLTAHGSEKVAVAAMKQGAYDYLTKPFDIDEVAVVIERALEARRLRVDNRRLAAEQTLGRRIVGDVAADAPPARGDVARRLARRHRARARRDRHRQGVRRRAPPRAVDARDEAARPVQLRRPARRARRGRAVRPRRAARSPARPRTRPGFFAQADGGTLILDEVGELPLAIQAKLLRALQEGEIQPVGSGRIEKVDVRVVASTNRDLAAEVKAGTFREDLYYRLAVVELVVPPLRDRKDDIPALADEFARRYGERFGLGNVVARARARRRARPHRLARQRPPAREHDRAARRAVERRRDRARRLPGRDESSSSSTRCRPPPMPDHAEPPLDARNGPSLKEQVEAFERGLVGRALDATGGNQSEAARRLGVSRVTLIDKMKKYGLASKR